MAFHTFLGWYQEREYGKYRERALIEIRAKRGRRKTNGRILGIVKSVVDETSMEPLGESKDSINVRMSSMSTYVFIAFVGVSNLADV